MIKAPKTIARNKTSCPILALHDNSFCLWLALYESEPLKIELSVACLAVYDGSAFLFELEQIPIAFSTGRAGERLGDETHFFGVFVFVQHVAPLDTQ